MTSLGSREAVEPICSLMLSTEDLPLKRTIIYALTILADPRAIPSLLTTGERYYNQLGFSLWNTFVIINDPRAVTELEKLLKKIEEANPDETMNGPGVSSLISLPQAINRIKSNNIEYFYPHRTIIPLNEPSDTITQMTVTVSEGDMIQFVPHFDSSAHFSHGHTNLLISPEGNGKDSMNNYLLQYTYLKPSTEDPSRDTATQFIAYNHGTEIVPVFFAGCIMPEHPSVIVTIIINPADNEFTQARDERREHFEINLRRLIDKSEDNEFIDGITQLRFIYLRSSNPMERQLARTLIKENKNRLVTWLTANEGGKVFNNSGHWAVYTILACNELKITESYPVLRAMQSSNETIHTDVLRVTRTTLENAVTIE